MIAFIIRRLLQGIFVLMVVSILIFSVMRLLPGDPVKLYVAQNQLEKITPQQMEQLKHEFGLDKSIALQYVHWIGGAVRGNFGKSIFYNEKVSTLLKERLPVTFHIGVCAFILSCVIGVAAGIVIMCVFPLERSKVVVPAPTGA